MHVVNERHARASSLEILATPDPAVPHRILDQFAGLNLSPSRFNVRRVNAHTTTINISFDTIGAQQARRIAARIRRIIGVKSVEVCIALNPSLSVVDEPRAHVASPTGDQPNGADLLLETLASLGVDTIFGYPGGAALPIYDSLYKQSKIRHILVRHELRKAQRA